MFDKLQNVATVNNSLIYLKNLPTSMIQHLHTPYLLKPISEYLTKTDNLSYGLHILIARTVLLDLKNLPRLYLTSSINQCLLKMQGKFEINQNHHLTNRSKLIYIKNRDREKALQYLETCLWWNLINLLTIMKDLFILSLIILLKVKKKMD